MPMFRPGETSQDKAIDFTPVAEPLADESLSGKLNREFGLLAQLPGGALAAAQEKLTHPVDLAVQLGVATAVGFGVISLSKNPALLGEAAAPYVKGMLKWVDKLSGPAMAIDWANRLGAPMISTWLSAENDSSARADISRNVGGGIVDYTTGLFGMRAGGRMAEYVEAPAFAAAKIESDSILDAARRVKMEGESPILALKTIKTFDYSKIMRDRAFDMVRIRSFSSAMTAEGLSSYYQSKNSDLGSDLTAFLRSDAKINLDQF